MNLNDKHLAILGDAQDGSYRPDLNDRREVAAVAELVADGFLSVEEDKQGRHYKNIDGMSTAMRANVEADARFYRSKITPEEVAVLDALQGKGSHRRHPPRAADPFRALRPGEAVEVVRWSWTAGHKKAHALCNKLGVRYEEIWNMGHRDWGVRGDITIAATAGMLKDLSNHNPYEHLDVHLVPQSEARALRVTGKP